MSLDALVERARSKVGPGSQRLLDNIDTRASAAPDEMPEIELPPRRTQEERRSDGVFGPVLDSVGDAARTVGGTVRDVLAGGAEILGETVRGAGEAIPRALESESFQEAAGLRLAQALGLIDEEDFRDPGTGSQADTSGQTGAGQGGTSTRVDVGQGGASSPAGGGGGPALSSLTDSIPSGLIPVGIALAGGAAIVFFASRS